MKASAVQGILPPSLRRNLQALGADIRIARLKRGLSVQMMTERTGLSKATYQKIEKGNPRVAMAGYAMVFHVLGFEAQLARVAAAEQDEVGLSLDRARLPQRIRTKREPRAS